MEIWKDIKNFEGYYQVSNFGRVKSVARDIDIVKKNMRYIIKWEEKIIKPNKLKTGYNIVHLRKDNKRYGLTIHRLVAVAFLYNKNKSYKVNHKNGIKTDNRVENLEWCNCFENMKHAYENNLINIKNRCKKIICIEESRSFDSIKSASVFYKINPCCISHCLNGLSKTAGGYHWRFL